MDLSIITKLLPALARDPDPAFNLFDVMHHGTHEKQLSNVFAWLLDADGSHGLGTGFQKIFTDVVTGQRSESPITGSALSVRQEVNVAPPGAGMDIADLVLENEETVLVVENYRLSDGHGHGFARYHAYGSRDGKRSIVVMLCATVNAGLLADGWQNAAVVPYAVVIERLMQRVSADAKYQRTHPDLMVFFNHLYRRYVKDSLVNDDDMLGFVEAMCRTGQARFYRATSAEAAATAFADALRESAADQFLESRAWLTSVKAALMAHTRATLLPALERHFDAPGKGEASGNFSGIFASTIGIRIPRDEQPVYVQFKLGASAWFACEEDEAWQRPEFERDYTRILLTNPKTKQLALSSVSLLEVLNGLGPDDDRLLRELVALIG